MLVIAGLVAIVALTAGPGAGALTGAVAAGAVLTGVAIRAVGRGETPLVAAQKAVVVALLFLMPVVIDPHTADVFAVVKFSILATGGVALLCLFVADLVTRRDHRRPGLIHGLVAFLVVWAVVSTLSSGHARLSTLGYYSSNNGLAAVIALALVFAVTANTFRRRDIEHVVRVMWFGTTGVVVFYGVLQLLDRAFADAGFEPVNWPGGVGVRVFGTTGVWSTFGNPNHFGGFCALALPLGFAAFVGARSQIERVVAGLIGIGAVIIIGQTSSRGAWVAAAVGTLLVIIANRRVIAAAVSRRRWIVPAGAVAVVGSVGASLNSGLLSKGTSSLLETGGTSTIAQRLNFWRTTVNMAADEPLLGFGFEGYRLTWPNYVSSEFIGKWGYDLSVTGPHNTFFAHLYWGGWPALLAFVVVIVVAARLLVRGARRLADDGTARTGLYALGATALGYLVVESFNVERVELAVIFWFAVGLVTAVAVDVDQPAVPVRRRASSRDLGLVAAAALITVVGLAATSSPWRADRALRDAGVASQRARELIDDPINASASSTASRRSIDDAVDTNPWEARYRRVRADSKRSQAQALAESQERRAEAVSAYRSAAADYADALELTPHDPAVYGPYAEVLFRLGALEDDAAQVAAARRLLEREVAYGPRNGRVRAYLGLQLVLIGEAEDGIGHARAALRMYPDDENVRRFAEQAAERAEGSVGAPLRRELEATKDEDD